MQGAFIDALVLPIFKLLAQLLPLVDEYCIKSLQSNRAFWSSMQNQDIITTEKILVYLKNIRNPNEEYSASEKEISVKETKSIEEPIPGIPANAPKAHSHTTRKLSLISMADSVSKFADPELGEMKAPSQEEEPEQASEKKYYYKSIQSKLRGLLEHNVVQIVLLVSTIYALFANDINIAFGSKEADNVIDIFSLIVLFIFVIEMIFSIICVPKYLQFFLWLDLAATISLLFEIDLLFGYDDSPGELSLAKASRAAKAGARAGR